MDKNYIASLLADIQKEKGDLDLWSSDYLFNREHAEDRSKIQARGGPEVRRSRLSLLLREGMTPERREKVFPGPYDLGNLKDIPADLSTYEELARHLAENGWSTTSSADMFDTIRDHIDQITGKKMLEHFKTNKSTALKVIKTLHMVSRKSNPRIMSLLGLPKPGQKFSLSFREAYPYEKNQDQVWGIADLKAYLSVELDEERIAEISDTFELLHEQMDNTLINVERILIEVRRLDYAELMTAYDSLVAAVNAYPLEPIENVDIPLDQALFIHLYVLDYAHFAVGYPQLIKVAVPDYTVASVAGELSALTRKVFPSLSPAAKEYDLLIPLWDTSAFASHWRDEIIPIMNKAMGMDFGGERYEKMADDAKRLLTSYYFFRNIAGSALANDQTNTNIWYVVAALCCVWYTSKFGTISKPYWSGQQAQGGSINTSNKLPELTNDAFIDDVPEEHRHIWANRLDWFANALRGQTELTERRFAMRSALVEKMLDICRHTNRTDWIEQAMMNLIQDIKTRTLEIAKQ